MVWLAQVGGARLLQGRGSRRAGLLGAVLGGLLLTLMPFDAMAATIPVGVGGCTLPDAIIAANTNATSGACPTGAGADTIVLQTNATYSLTTVVDSVQGPTGLPAITSEITIQGNNASIERGTGPSLRLLRVGAGGALTLDDVNLRYGDLGSPTTFDGGGILVESGASLAATSSLFDTNIGRNGGGLFVATGGSAIVTSTTFRGNVAREAGGAIANDGTATVTDSELTQNFVNTGGTHGGGITSSGSLTVRRSMIRGSEAPDGGGLYLSGTTELTNSTVSGNRARTSGAGGLEVVGGTVTVRNSTISQNGAVSTGGGILASGGSVSLANTIVAANATGGPSGNWDTGNTAAPNADCFGGVTSNGHNLVGQGTGCPTNGAADKTEPPITVLTRVMGPLGNNGGPTLTYHLKPSSPAVDAGDPGVCGAAPVGAVDQRGRPRPAACDIGAVEATFGQITVTGGCTLADAITAANTDTATGGCAAGNGADTIDLQAAGPFTLSSVNNNGGIIIGPSGLPAVTTMIRIQGSGRIVERASGAPSFRIFVVRDGGDLTLDGITVRNGRLDDGRGAGVGIFGGFLTLINAEVSGNASVNGNTNSLGGGIAVEVNGAFSDAQLTLVNSVVKNNQADAGGGISHLRRVTLTNSTVETNTAKFRGGGIYSLAPLTVTNSTIRSNVATQPVTGVAVSSTGGGIATSGVGTLTITGSTISGNGAVSGAGIYIVAGTTQSTIANSTISRNTALGPAESNPSGSLGGFAGAGIEVMRSPGGLALINSTVADNHSTQASGAGGILIGHFGGTNSVVTLSNSIVVGNLVAGALTSGKADCARGPAAGPDVTSSGGNVVGSGTGCPTSGSGDRTAPPSDAFTAVLGPLSANGGPTQTHALQDGSPAIDAGDAAVCAAAPVAGVDQRGTARARCDSGAYEGGTPFPPPGSPIVVNGVCTLIEAIVAANTDAPFGGCSAGLGADTIVLAASSTHTLTTAYETAVNPGPNGLPTITSEIIIEGNGATVQRVAADSVPFRIFFVTNGGALTLRNLTVRGGRTATGLGAGGGIFVRGATARLTLDTVTVRDNVSAGEGGGIANGSVFTAGDQGGTVTLTSSVVSSNSATAAGGGISTEGGTFTVTNSTISNNLCTGGGTTFGGGILVSGTTFTMTGGSISTNSARSAGGLSNGGNVTLTNVQITGNQATATTGGGIDNRGALRLVGGAVTGNTAVTSGGGIASLIENLVGAAAGLTLEGTTVSTNSAGQHGGGMLTHGSATLTDGTIQGNTATTSGGGLQMLGAGAVVTLDGTTVARNQVTAGSGGGIANGVNALPAQTGGTLTVRNSTIRENTVVAAPPSLGAAGGGGIAAIGGKTEVIGTTVRANSLTTPPGVFLFALGAGIMGSAFTIAPTEIVVTDSTIADNNNGGTGAAGGGLTAMDGTSMQVTRTTLSGNRAIEGGGIFVGAGGVGTVTESTIRANSAGRGGGATLLLIGSLTLERTTVAENTATTAIAAGMGYGGGLVNNGGTLVVTRSTVADNRADGPYGGGIASLPTGGAGANVVTVRNSLISGNQATNGSGGGIYNEGTAVALLDSTVSGNTAGQSGGGAFHNTGGSFSVAGSTIADNRAGVGGGGLYSGPPIRLRNSIVAGNQRGGSLTNTTADCGPNVVSDGHNLTGTGTGCPSGGTGDLTVAPAEVFSKVLGPLAENGGPTKTHALPSGSPAIDAGNPSPVSVGNPTGCSDADQRGEARPTDGNNDGTPRCDIGAFEARAGTTPARCAPRPNVGLAVTPAGAGRLQVVVTAQTGPATPTNSLSQFRITAPPNAVVDVVGGPQGTAGETTYAPPAGTSQVTLFVRRVAPGPVQVPLIVTDECGPWPTFVGGGPAAF